MPLVIGSAFQSALARMSAEVSKVCGVWLCAGTLCTWVPAGMVMARGVGIGGQAGGGLQSEGQIGFGGDAGRRLVADQAGKLGERASWVAVRR